MARSFGRSSWTFYYLVSMERDDIQTLKGFASVIQSAGRVSLQADESGIDHYQNAGRPSGSGRIESSNSGGHKDEEIKIRPAVESCWHLGEFL